LIFPLENPTIFVTACDAIIASFDILIAC
jgi:hypothetical protein